MKIIKKCLCILLIIILCVGYTHCYADIPSNLDTTIEPNSDAGIRTSAAKIWGSVKLVLQVVALSALLFTGVRYMLASADQKADIKKSSIMLVIGVVVVFGTTIIIDFITKVAGELMNV